MGTLRVTVAEVGNSLSIGVLLTGRKKHKEIKRSSFRYRNKIDIRWRICLGFYAEFLQLVEIASSFCLLICRDFVGKQESHCAIFYQLSEF